MTKMDKVRRALAERAGRGATIDELTGLCDMHYRHIHNCLSALTNRGLVRRSGGGWSDPHRYFWKQESSAPWVRHGS